MLLWLAGVLAWAGPALDACCRAAGAATCPDTVEAMGPGSQPMGARLRGVWVVPCDGPQRFDAQREVPTTGPNAEGTVFTPLVPAAAQCFDATCRLPRGLCLRIVEGRYRLVDCASDVPASATTWSAPAGEPGRVAVVAGRVLRRSPGPLPEADAPPTDAPKRPLGATAAGLAVDPRVPAPPPTPCIPDPTLRKPSIDQVDLGNEAMVAGDWARATDTYRAAITIDPCNGFAWSSLADALVQTGHAHEALQAAEPATRLLPRSAHPWTILGRAAQATGDREAAIRAYEQALAVQPGHPAAASALSGLR